MEIEPSDTQPIRLLGGHTIKSIGRVVGDFMFQGDKDIHHRHFHVLPTSVYDVVLGRGFLEQTKTLTEYFHRIVEKVRPCIRKGRCLF